MPWTRTAERRQSGAPAVGRSPGVTVSGRPAPLSRAAIIRAAELVLLREHRSALLSISLVGRDRMRALNLRWKGKPGPTDVLAFPLPGPAGTLAGDIYLCPWVAAREARARRIPLRQELERLVVHGVLHVLGFAHPEGSGREDSPMWRRQERYLKALQ